MWVQVMKATYIRGMNRLNKRPRVPHRTHCLLLPLRPLSLNCVRMFLLLQKRGKREKERAETSKQKSTTNNQSQQQQKKMYNSINV